MYKKNNKFQQGSFSSLGFTLIEIMIGILISSMIIILGFQALNAIMIGKVKLIESTNIEKESFSFMQKFFEEIKSGGLIDYEEYFNRKVVNGNLTGNALYSSGHFKKFTGFGNFGIKGKVGSTIYNNNFYYCRSGNGSSNKMTGTGCIDNFNTDGTSVSGLPQSYGQYSFHFIDYNSNYDSDLGNEDGIGGIIGDDDDEYLGKGPEVFQSGTGITELYLISANKKKRTLFRWTVKDDPYIKNSVASCDFTNAKAPTGSGCLGTIEFLKLDGKDWGMAHNKTGVGLYDGVIDTWLINKDFASGNEIIAGSNNTNYWLPLFPDSINVSSFDIRAYPNKDIKDAWREENIDVAPYIRINMTLTPSWKVKKRIKGKVPEFNISTTINLIDIFSR